METIKDERRKRERLVAQGGGNEQIESIGPVQLAIEKLEDAEPKDAQRVADRLVDGQPARVAIVVLTGNGKLTFVCKVGDEAKSKGAHAGNIVKEMALVSGGGGGGRPDFAMAGGKEAAMFDQAIEKAKETLGSQVGLK